MIDIFSLDFYTTVEKFTLRCLAAYAPAAVRVARAIWRSLSINYSAKHSTFRTYSLKFFV